MKQRIAYCLFFFLIGLSFSSGAQFYKKKIQKGRDVKEKVFLDKERSPLKKENVDEFSGLKYFEIDKKYRIKAELYLTPDAEVFEMETTTERRPKYRQYGYVQFDLGGKNHTLSIFQNQDLIKKEGYENYLFLPFWDETNGNESYGGGRFLDLRMPKRGDKMKIDFNYAYNPYCAYSDRWSCPIPPPENEVNVRIEAGEKALYDEHDH